MKTIQMEKSPKFAIRHSFVTVVVVVCLCILVFKNIFILHRFRSQYFNKLLK